MNTYLLNNNLKLYSRQKIIDGIKINGTLLKFANPEFQYNVKVVKLK